MPTTTTIEAPEQTSKSGKRARKSASPRKPVPVRANGKQRPTAPTTKTNQVLGLLRRVRGASISDLSTATGWQAHSVRGFLSGTVKKKMGLVVVSEKDGKGVRRYRIATDVAA
jgi:hypothetical protein